ncbi:helix-turn-helix domain-containing protein [Dinoroseobacter sp. S76]|uniref:helix-turn-helix domain-containing protein n=1 Tax=Dinoroseobacter sp. S76 TaxID=3415124 RepID=UPI003C7E3703
MTQTAYARAVDLFEALVTAPERDAHTTPARLIQSAGLPASTGYRHVAALEADGLLRRDESGTYLPGLSAIRTGLRGFGLGRLAPLAQPTLLQLRQMTQHTAFLAVLQDMDVHMGPHSLGRETRLTRLSPRYSFDVIPDLTLGAVSALDLRAFEDGIPRRTATLMVPVEATSRQIVTLGLVLNPSRGSNPDHHRALLQVHARVADALQDR